MASTSCDQPRQSSKDGGIDSSKTSNLQHDSADVKDGQGESETPALYRWTWTAQRRVTGCDETHCGLKPLI